MIPFPRKLQLTEPNSSQATWRHLARLSKSVICQLVREAPSDDEWAHELKFDSYRMHARLDRGDVHLWTRTGLECAAESRLFGCVVLPADAAAALAKRRLQRAQEQGPTIGRWRQSRAPT
jgi:hypothetical protein